MEVSQDITFEIFSWLPAKSICKFKSTCNSSSEFSEETLSKTKQAHNMFGRDDTCFFILRPDQISQSYTEIVESHSLPQDRQSSGAPKQALRFLSNSVCVLVTKSWSSLPTPESFQRNHSFAGINLMLDCSLDDFNVFLLENSGVWSPTSYTCSVYHSKGGVRTTMKNSFSPGGRNMEFDMPLFHKGCLHFISDCASYFAKSSPFYKPYIMSYNLENGISTMFKLPREAIKGCHIMCNMGIFNWGKKTSSDSSICLVKLINYVFTVWFLKDYESGSCKKVLKVRVRALRLNETNPNVRGFIVMNGNLLVFATEEKLYSYGLEGESYMMVEEICRHNYAFKPRFISYSDTLRSCGTNARAMPC
ncbi:hypothetical protein MTR_2g450270 [Medicago truncatula]|uniref:F-box protein interaction domain protein n=1 Tax=Medicago truncatula TaxID=3880 RepID=A0A072V778_MEDTR|nr:hypothetical protein MTR_2g450270 [Medicago truncatula]